MEPHSHSRKVLLLKEKAESPAPPVPLPKPDIIVPAMTSNATSSLPSRKPLPVITRNTTSSPPSRKPLQPASLPFDSSMVLTILFLLAALFFMGFFSIYIRRISDDDPSTQFSRRRRHRSVPDRYSNAVGNQMSTTSRKGLDPAAVGSLPVYSYHGDAKYQVDCAICLSEFQDGETVKMIPCCKHVFHVECIGTWLASHVSCPVCRRTQLFESQGDSGILDHQGGGSTADNDDTCVEVGSLSLRRSSSSSSLGAGNRIAVGLLHRTSSF